MLLTMMGRLSERDIMLAASIFDKLDYNSDGKNHGNECFTVFYFDLFLNTEFFSLLFTFSRLRFRTPILLFSSSLLPLFFLPSTSSLPLFIHSSILLHLAFCSFDLHTTSFSFCPSSISSLPSLLIPFLFFPIHHTLFPSLLSYSLLLSPPALFFSLPSHSIPLLPLFFPLLSLLSYPLYATPSQLTSLLTPSFPTHFFLLYVHF